MASQLRIPLWRAQHNPLLLRGTRWLTHGGWEKLGHRLVKPTYVTNISLATAQHIPQGPVQHRPAHTHTGTQLSNIHNFEDMAQDTDVYGTECAAQRWRRVFWHTHARWSAVPWSSVPQQVRFISRAWWNGLVIWSVLVSDCWMVCSIFGCQQRNVCHLLFYLCSSHQWHWMCFSRRHLRCGFAFPNNANTS